MHGVKGLHGEVARRTEPVGTLQLLSDPPKNADFVAYQFPTDRHRDEYLATIGQRSEAEVRTRPWESVDSPEGVPL